MSALFHTEDLSIGYSQDKVLQRQLNLSLKKGMIVSLMGQNGVGKTTFLKTLSKLLPTLSGSIYYDNQSVNDLTAHELSTRLSLVLTEKPSAGNLTVKELIAFGRHPFSNWLGILSKKDWEIVEWALSETQINYIENKRLAELSDGQLQKVMIAKALAQETPIIFLDEPTAHLDLHNKIEIMMLLKKIAAQGKGILISTHDLQISLQLSDEIWLFNFNQPVIAGMPEELILNGSFEQTLFLQAFNYDFKTGLFDSPQPPTQKSFRISGHQEGIYWTERALAKKGLTKSNDIHDPMIEVQADQWILTEASKEISFKTLSDLIKQLT
ncbi:MAG: iron complex transport system ATP-binding protein [Cyclobacteriaceae bacterium]|jgi:iron complex transport system ATP-binding protein